MFQDPEYARWANEKTVHVLSYDLDKNAEKPEPTLEVERDGVKVTVLAMYPMFTPNEADLIAREMDRAVEFPSTVPWTGVIATDGKTVLASVKKATGKEFRELYEAEQKKVPGAFLARDAWKRVRTFLEESTAAEFDEKWPDAIAKAVAARAVTKEPSPALADRLTARFDSLDAAAKSRIEALDKIRDPAARAKAREAIRSDFRGIPSADALPAAR